MSEVASSFFSKKIFTQFSSLVLLTFIVYYPTFQAGFVWDDHVFFIRDRLMTAPDGLWRIWFDPGTKGWNYWPLIISLFKEDLFGMMTTMSLTINSYKH